MGNFKGKGFPAALIVVACFVFYGNAIPNDYAFDDAVVVTDNQFTQKGISGIPAIFGNNTFRGSYETTPTVARYRPLSVATFALEYQFFGPNPQLSHFKNVLLLILASLLLHAILAKVFGGGVKRGTRFDFPLIATLLFIAHPVHTEVVANIKGRDELLVLAGALAATLSVLKYLDTRAARYGWWSLVLFSVALFSKESAITFLAIIPLTIYYYRETKGRDYLRALAPLFLATAVFLGAMGLALRGSGPLPPPDILTEPFANTTLAQRFATACYTFGVYLRLLVFPHPLTIDYYPFHLQWVTWRNPVVWISLLVFVAMTSYALWKLRTKSIVAYGILFFLVSFSVVSNLPFSIGTFMSERFLFVPSIGFIVIVAWFLSTKLSMATLGGRLVLLAIMLVGLGKTITRNGDWKNDFTLFTSDVVTSHDSIKGNLAAAVSYLLESQKVDASSLAGTYRARALEHAKQAVSLYEQHLGSDRMSHASYGHARTLLCDCYGANNQLVDALQCYKQVVPSLPDRDPTCGKIEAAISKSNDVGFQIQSFLEFATLVPDNFLFNYRLGYLYGKEKGDLVRSIQYLQKAVEIRPKETHALEALSHAYKLLKDYDRAAFYLEQAAAEDPANRSHLTRLLAIYQLAGNREKEREIMRRLGQP